MERLRLDDNLLDDDAMKHLARGKWDLVELWLGCNKVSPFGIKYLTQGEWPLRQLRLDASAASPKTGSVLSLAADYLPDPVILWSSADPKAPRMLDWLASGQEGVWPGLKGVISTSHKTVRRKDGSRLEHVYTSADRW